MMMDMWNKSRFQVATSLLVALKTTVATRLQESPQLCDASIAIA